MGDESGDQLLLSVGAVLGIFINIGNLAMGATIFIYR